MAQRKIQTHQQRQRKTQPARMAEQTPMLRRLREGGLIVSMATSVFLLIALATYHASDPGWSATASSDHIRNAGGRVGAWFADLTLYLVGYSGFLFPLLLGYGGARLWRRAETDNPLPRYLYVVRSIGFLLVMSASSGLLSLCLIQSSTHVPFTAGGVLGNVVGFELQGEFNTIGAVLLLVTAFLVGVTFYTGLSWITASRRVIKTLSIVSVKIARGLGYGVRYLIGYINNLLRETWVGLQSVSRQLKQWRADRAGRADRKANYNNNHLKPHLQPNVNLETSPKISTSQSKVNIALGSVSTSASTAIVSPVAAPKPTGAVKSNHASKLAQRLSNQSGASTVVLPDLNLLDAPADNSDQGYSTADLEHMSCEVEQKLRDYGIEARVVAVHPGPVITRFELQPAAGVKVSKITSLSKDLARSLSVISVRVVEVIPGKSVVGLEVPNQHREMVRLSEIIGSESYQQARSFLTLALGHDIAGHPVAVDLAKMPHLLVAGTTGSGKSVGLNAMLLSLLYKATPADVRLILVDPKMLELAIYEGIPHLLAPVVTDMKEAANALRWCVAEMERRYRLMAALGVRNLTGFNNKIQQARQAGKPILDPLYRSYSGNNQTNDQTNSQANTQADQAPELDTLPYIVVLIDEFADMMMVVGKKVEQLIARIAQKARAAGIHLILATQRPSVDVITGLIKANVPTRIAFQVSSRVDSRTILDQQGAENLLGYGDMLYMAPGTGVPMRVHGAFVDDHEVHQVVDAWKAQSTPDYVDAILNGGNFSSDEVPTLTGLEEDSDSEADPLYDQAVQIVIETRRASISSIQRRLKIGYNRAARLIETMEAAGLVGPMEGNGSRDVLIPKAEAT